MIRSLHWRIGLMIFVTAATIAGYWFTTEPTPQPLSYHNFADQRTILGVPHACNVLSNLPIVLVGIWGLAFMAGAGSRCTETFVEGLERLPYWIYFLGLTLTGIGSAYYHADPNNTTLVWDRLPLTIAFMGLFTAILAERVHPWCARWLVAPLVALGAASVFYWDWTEGTGAGDLRPYFTVQFFPLIALAFMLLLYPPRYTGSADLVASLGCYALAKIVEILDREIYTGTGFVSGHTLKHLIAGLAAWFILHMLQTRKPAAAGEGCAAR
jgi:hypothetical protein